MGEFSFLCNLLFSKPNGVFQNKFSIRLTVMVKFWVSAEGCPGMWWSNEISGHVCECGITEINSCINRCVIEGLFSPP